MANNLLDKSSIILTPTAYNNGEALCVKPSDGSGDFDFSRNSAATRVNAQGLVENVQILSSNLVQNGDFSEEGVQGVSNGSFTNGSTDWTLGTGWSIAEDKATCDGTDIAQIYQINVLTQNKTYKVTYTITSYVSGSVKAKLGDNIFGADNSANGTYTEYIYFNQANLNFHFRSNNFIGSITNISVKEVGMDWAKNDEWSIGSGVAECDGSNGKKIYQNIGLATNKYYEFTIEVKTLTSGAISLFYNNGSYQTVASGLGLGTHTFQFYTSGTPNGFIYINSQYFIGSVTNISVIEITDDTNLPRINYEGFSYQDALGSEQVVNGTFDDGTNNWINNNSNLSVESGKLKVLSTSGFGNAEQNISVQGGKTYNISVDFTYGGTTEGRLNLYDGTGLPIEISKSEDGIISTQITISSGQTNLRVRLVNQSATTSVYNLWDNVSVKEYLGQEVVPNSGCGSWLWEPQSTNLLTYSELFSDASWVKINSSVVSGFASPSGNTNAYKLIASASNTDHRTRTAPIATAALGTTVTFSIYIKPQEITKIALVDNWTNLSYGVVNLTTNSVIEEAQGTTSVTEILNGFRRVSFTYQTANINTLPAVYLLDDSYTSGNPTSYTFASNGTSGVYIWGAQLEQQSYATSYIPTSGSTVTRNQDVCTNGGSLATINSTEGVLYAEIKLGQAYSSSRYIGLSNGGTSNRVIFGVPGNATSTITWFIGSGGQVNGSATGVDFSIFNKIALKYSENNVALWINGVKVNTNLSVSMPTGLNTLEFNQGGSGNLFYGKTKAVAVWKEALSDSELQSLTTI